MKIGRYIDHQSNYLIKDVIKANYLLHANETQRVATMIFLYSFTVNQLAR